MGKHVSQADTGAEQVTKEMGITRDICYSSMLVSHWVRLLLLTLQSFAPEQFVTAGFDAKEVA